MSNLYGLYRFLIYLYFLMVHFTETRKQRKSCKRQRRQPLSQSTVERRQPGHGVFRGEIEIPLVSNGSETNNPHFFVPNMCGFTSLFAQSEMWNTCLWLVHNEAWESTPMKPGKQRSPRVHSNGRWIQLEETHGSLLDLRFGAFADSLSVKTMVWGF